MSSPVLVVSEDMHRREALRSALRALGFEVLSKPVSSVKLGDLPPCAVALVEVRCAKSRHLLHTLSTRSKVSKLLALLPFGADVEARELMAEGVDDVLCGPFSSVRLEISLRNLLRLHVLERAGAASMHKNAVA